MAGIFVRSNLLHLKVLRNPCRNGYIVLLPEATAENPPLTFKGNEMPDIRNLTSEECVSMVGKHVLDFESNLWKIEKKLKDMEEGMSLNVYEDIFVPLEKFAAPLDVSWGLMKTLYYTNASIMPDKTYMSIHDRARRARSQKFSSPLIYTACQNADTKILSEEKRRLVNKFLLEGQLNGLGLNESNKANLRSITQKINNEKFKFGGKVKVSTSQFKHTIVDPNIVRDFPESLTKAMAYDRSHYSKGPWTVTLQPYLYSQFMEYCPIRELRWNAWQANVRRSSNSGDRAVETSTNIEELRSLRGKQAKLLGFENFAELSMKTKMAGNVENVQKMLERLLRKAYPAQEREVHDLQKFAVDRGFEGSLELWDIPYWKRKQLRTLYSFDEEEVKEYFPFPHVLQELFALFQRLFGVDIVQEKNENVWHPDVQFFNIFDVKSSKPIASFFLDPYARSGEKKGLQDNMGWMIAIRNRSEICNHQPLAALLFNFVPGSENSPCLLTFRDVYQLFVKFGHALPHLLTTTPIADISGLSNIEWDAVGVCSNFMSHWLFQSETMRCIGRHYKTGDSLPEEILNSLEQLPQLMAGYELCQQLYFSSLDLKLHSSKEFWLDITREIWPHYFVFPLDKMNAHPCSFSAIFSEEWAAAYYSHVWSRVVAADVFNAFQEVGLNNTQELAKLGERLRSTFLSLGGGCHPSEVFRRFRGRDPSPNALLWSLGLKPLPTAPADVSVEV